MRPDFGLGRGFQQYEVGHPHRMNGDNGKRMQWLETQAAKAKLDPEHRFFLFVHSYDIHSDVDTPYPYWSPPRYRLRFFPRGENWERRGDTKLLMQMRVAGSATERDKLFLNALYDGGVLFTDQEVLAPLMAKLRSLDLWEDTLVVITSDHGEEIFAHGWATHQQPYEETARVPLVFTGAGVPRGLRIAEPVELVDLTPTILSLLELPIPANVQGQDLGRLMRGQPLDRNTVFVDGLMGGVPVTRDRKPSNATAAFDGELWSYIAQVDPGQPGAIEFQIIGEPELYRLAEDPGQQHNLIAEHPEIAAELRQRMLDWYDANRALQVELVAAAAETAAGAARDARPPILSDEEIEALKALGYVGDDAR